MAIDSDELYQQILTRLLANVPADVDKREGSIIYNALSPVALELQQVYEELKDVQQETFADTASLDSLILRARERGIEWKEATKAVVKATLVFSAEITAEPTIVGSVFGVENSELFYDATEKVSWDGTTNTGVYLLTCQEAGTAGNLGTGDLLLEETEDDDVVDNITSATITQIYDAARDDEELEDFRARYFDSIENEAFGGNVADYTTKALELPQVGAVQVVPVWNGAGTVKVRFLNASKGIPTATEIAEVQTAFDPSPQATGVGLAPIGHTVTVVAATKVDMAVVATVTFESGYDWASLHDSIEEQCEAYFLQLREEWSSGAVTVSPGVLAYMVKLNCQHITTFSCTINTSSADFVLNTDEVPVLSSLTQAGS